MKKTGRAISGREGREAEPTQESGCVRTVIASTPGVAEQSLRATLASLSSLDVVGSAAGCLSALQMVRDSQADLVVIDANLPFEDVKLFLQRLKEEKLITRSLVLAATSSQVRRSLAAGADAALRRDASVGQLGAVVEGFHRDGPAECTETEIEPEAAGRTSAGNARPATMEGYR